MTDIATTIHNERIKLTAAFLNAMGVAIFAVGGLAPAFTTLYGDRPITIPLILGVVICLLASATLHYGARRSLRGLRS